MKTFKCNVAQKGYYAGAVYCIKKGNPESEIKASDSQVELAKFHDAVEKLKESINGNNASEKVAEIRETVLTILEDIVFTEKVESYIKDQSYEAATAVVKTGEDIAEEFSKIDNEYIRSRQDDVRGVAAKLAAVIKGEADGPKTLSAICAGEISPAQLSSIPEDLIGGMVTYKGSPNSHAAILAGSMGIPYLYGNDDAVNEAEKSGFIIIDSEDGTVTTDPDEETKKAALARMEEVIKKKLEEAQSLNESESGPKCRTGVYANIAGPQEIEALLESGADGVGLFRTEFLFLGRDSMPTEDEQYDAYRKILEAMGDKEVIIRTMDIGSDKKVSWLKIPEESNPALGLRGVRVSLEQKDIFITQLRALLRAGVAGNLKVMFPMVASLWEIDEIEEKMKEAAEGLSKEGIAYKMPEWGIMVETPAAAICAEEMAKKASFFSIGTNDLTQYTLAIDREAEGLDRYFDPHHEAIFKLIKMITDGAHKNSIPVGVCGQLGVDSEAIKMLIEAGVDELSVPLKMVKITKKLVAEAEREIDEKSAKKEVAKAAKARVDDTVTAVADGELIPMAEIPDPVFAQGIMGECFGILPTNGNVYAPVSGFVESIAETGHAVTIKADDGRSLLVHVGIDTVKLGTKAFKHHVKEGDHVGSNQLIMEADIEMIEKAGLSPMIIVIKIK